jgi:hypothetical protein
MFTRQAANIAQALYLSGIPQASAAAAQNLMGQCRGFIEHRGPVRFDYTNPNFRLITPPLAPLTSGGGSGPPPEDFPPQDPGPSEEEQGEDPLDPPRPQDPEPPEHRRPQQPPFPGPGEGEPGFWSGTKDYYESDYTRINKRLRTISVRATDLRRHAVFPLNLNRANTFHSVDFKAHNFENGQRVDPLNPNARVTLEIEDRRDETAWNLRIKNLEVVDVLTDVALEQAVGGDWQLKFTKRSVRAFSPDPAVFVTFTMQSVNCLTDANLTPGSLDFPATQAWVLKTEAGTDASVPLADCEGYGPSS